MDKRKERKIRHIFKDYPPDFKNKLHDALGTIVIKSLLEINLFEFLNEPKAIAEITNKFNFTDIEFTNLILETLVTENYLQKNGDGFQNTKFLTETIDNMDRKLAVLQKLSFFQDAFEHYSNAIPKRMNGIMMTNFTDKKSTFTWDEVLKNPMYEHLRQATLAFGNALDKTGKFLDVGCGNGNGTIKIWKAYFNKGRFSEKSDQTIELFGIDPSEELLTIAQEEFDLWLGKELNLNRDEVKNKYKKYFPVFKKGEAHKLPFDDNYFDVVYASQVIHFDDAKKALKEMLRVLKPGGVAIGCEIIDTFGNVTSLTIEGAKGTPTIDEFNNILHEVEAKKIQLYEHYFLFFKYSK